MKTEHRLAETLKNMMAVTPLDEISVTSLTKKCKINRQSFYYHFHDIYDLLTLVFLDESIPGIEETESIAELTKAIYNYCNKNMAFISATLNSAAKDLLNEFLYNACYQTLMRFITKKTVNIKINNNMKKSIARFYSLGIAYSIIFYLSTHKTKSYESMVSTFSFIGDADLDAAIQKVAKEG